MSQNDGAAPPQVIGRTIVINNQRGLHARAAARFVKTAALFDARVTVSKGAQAVSGGSILGLMMLAAGPGTEIEINAEGDQAAAAVEALCDLITDNFEEC
ncbi:MAG: HPr family phosphocarrier protein [Rhodospirillales bacterium]|nr:HPr family phosphocarrier protein [Rhodospirillales bacterium]HJO97107.1 HPr family phosphocarrier protein [Rhodospirillales bacterium]